MGVSVRERGSVLYISVVLVHVVDINGHVCFQEKQEESIPRSMFEPAV